MKWAILLFILSLYACKTKHPACFIDATDIIKRSPQKLISVKDSGYKIAALYDEGWDSLKGGAYLFYPNEFLKSYIFYQSRKPVYMELYDKHGVLVKTTGSPMVSRIINELGEDSVYVEVQFFSLMKTYQSLNIKINKGSAVSYPLVTDSLFSNIKTVTFGFNSTDLHAISMYSHIIYTDDCTKTEHILSDSVLLIKDSRTGLGPATSK
jgi:hypothetical protein